MSKIENVIKYIDRTCPTVTHPCDTERIDVMFYFLIKEYHNENIATNITDTIDTLYMSKELHNQYWNDVFDKQIIKDKIKFWKLYFDTTCGDYLELKQDLIETYENRYNKL